MEEIAGYTELQTIVEGTTSQRYKAKTSPKLAIEQEHVALQLIDRTVSDEEFAILCEHLATATHTGSPHLANIYETGRADEKLYTASEHFPHGSLDNPSKPLSRVDVLQAMSAACLGAHQLHEVGIAHHCIQPKNIMLSNPVKLANVGILSILSPGQTLSGDDSDTPIEYQSPAYIQGQSFSRNNDIWALGATLHKTITGESIFPELPEDSLLATVRHILNTKPIMSHALRNGERKIIEKAVLLPEEERYTTASAMAEDLNEEAAKQKR